MATSNGGGAGGGSFSSFGSLSHTTPEREIATLAQLGTLVTKERSLPPLNNARLEV